MLIRFAFLMICSKWTSIAAVSELSSEKSNDAPVIFISGLNEASCKLMNISLDNCHCANTTVPKVVWICEQFSKSKKKGRSKVVPISCVVSSVLGLIGNFCVIYRTAFQWRRLKRFKRLIAWLSVSDFVYSLVQLIIYVPQLWTGKWLYGAVMCKSLYSVYQASVFISLGFVAIIAADRYFGIVHHFDQRRITTRVFWTLVSVNLTLAFTACAVQVPSLAYTKGVCKETWTDANSFIYSTVSLSVYFVLPFFVLAFFNLSIVSGLRRFFREAQKIVPVTELVRRYKRDRRIMRVLVAILFAYWLFVLPSDLAHCIYDYYAMNDRSTASVLVIRTLTEIPYGFHACVNPIAYTFVDAKVRWELCSPFRKFVRVLCAKKRNMVGNQSSTSSAASGITLVNMSSIYKVSK